MLRQSSHVRRQAITWTNAGLLSIILLEINFSEIRIGILSFPFLHTSYHEVRLTCIHLNIQRWLNKTVKSNHIFNANVFQHIMILWHTVFVDCIILYDSSTYFNFVYLCPGQQPLICKPVCIYFSYTHLHAWAFLFMNHPASFVASHHVGTFGRAITTSRIQTQLENDPFARRNFQINFPKRDLYFDSNDPKYLSKIVLTMRLHWFRQWIGAAGSGYWSYCNNFAHCFLFVVSLVWYRSIINIWYEVTLLIVSCNQRNSTRQSQSMEKCMDNMNSSTPTA